MSNIKRAYPGHPAHSVDRVDSSLSGRPGIMYPIWILRLGTGLLITQLLLVLTGCGVATPATTTISPTATTAVATIPTVVAAVITAVTTQPTTQHTSIPTNTNVPTAEAGSLKPSTGPASAKPYDHAADYSWVAGQLRQEGSCWIVTYVSPLVEIAADRYNNHFALLPRGDWDVAKVKDGEWLIVQGQPEPGMGLAPGCSSHGYKVIGLWSNPNAPGSSPAPGGNNTSTPSLIPSSTPAAPNDMQVRAGTWGGQHIGMVVSDGGTTLDFDCAHAKIAQPLTLDAAGHFDVAGTYVREHGGPVGVDETADSHPARFEGSTDGKTMTLTVTLTDTNQEVGSFTLTFGTPSGVFKCL